MASLNRILQVLKQVQTLLKQEDSNKYSCSEPLPADFRNTTSDMSPIFSLKMTNNSVPGCLRPAHALIYSLRTFCVYLRRLLRTPEHLIFSSQTLLYKFIRCSLYTTLHLRWASYRCYKLLLHLPSSYSVLQILSNFASIISIYKKGFAVVLEPYAESTEFSPVLQLSCVDPKVLMSELTREFPMILITSENKYSEILGKLLGVPVTRLEMPNPSSSWRLCPLMLTKGSDQLAISSNYEERDEVATIRNFGELLIELTAIVPDSVICYFPNFYHLQEAVVKWNETGLLHRLLEYKLVFFESANTDETKEVLEKFKLACTAGRGAVLLALAAGYTARHFHEPGPYKRCVIIFGVPITDILRKVLRAKLHFYREMYSIEESDYYHYDAVRHSVDLLATDLSGKGFSVMILADKRFALHPKFELLPNWFIKGLSAHELYLSTDGLVRIASNFLKQSFN